MKNEYISCKGKELKMWSYYHPSKTIIFKDVNVNNLEDETTYRCKIENTKNGKNTCFCGQVLSEQQDVPQLWICKERFEIIR